MKTRSMSRRMVRVTATPTKIEREILAKRQADEDAAAQGEARLSDTTVNHGSPRDVLHRYLDRAHAKYMSQFPPGFEPLAKSIEHWARARQDGRGNHDKQMASIRADIGTASTPDQGEDEQTHGRPVRSRRRRISGAH
jgi:hypothetical protein